MAQTNILTWNLSYHGLNRDKLLAVPFAQLIASVVQCYGAGLIGFSGLYGGVGAAFAATLVAELNNRDAKPDQWQAHGSPTLGLGRQEQYCFVWNSTLFAPATTSLTPGFQHEFPVPGHSDQFLGFPRLQSQSTDMPPFLGYFQLVGTARHLAVAQYTAPAWDPDAGLTVQKACASLAQVAAFGQGDGCLLMGTFHVPQDDNVATPNSPGAYAFTPLAGPNGPCTQLVANQPNVVASLPTVAMTMEEALVQTAGNFFFRKNAAGLACTSAGVANVLTQVFNTYDETTQQWAAQPLGPPLANLERRGQELFKAMTPTHEENGSYAKLEDALYVYQWLASSYLPLGVTLTY